MNGWRKVFRLKGRRGSALLAAMVFVTVFGVIVGNVLVASNQQTRNTYRSRLFGTTLAAAATIVDSMTQQAYYVATTRPEQMLGDFNNMDDLILAIQPKSLPGYRTVKAGDKDLTFMKAKGSNNGDFEVINDATDDWNGFNIARWSYQAVSFVNAADESTGAEDANAEHLGFEGAGFKADVEINFIPLYQYAIFYDNDLEIHNGPKMDVLGPVHSNRTLWVSCNDGLNFQDRVSAAGGFRSYNDFSKNESASTVDAVNKKNADLESTIGNHGGDVTIKNAAGNTTKMNNVDGWTADTNKNKMLDSLDKNWLSDALTRYGGKLQDAAMGITPIKPPLPYVQNSNGDRVQADAGDLIQPKYADDSASMKETKMVYKADVIIEGNAATSTWSSKKHEWSNINITDSDGNAIPNTVYDSNSKTYVSIVTPGSFYDNREGKLVNSFDVNMDVLGDRGTAIDNGNGLLYVSPTGGSLPSVRLTNASDMPTNARNTMTVATDKPLYLAGNVNTTSNRATLLLAADAITVLSEGQNLTVDNTKDSGKPKAKGATITNAIFMLGQVSSKYSDNEDHYTEDGKRVSMSGGAHNVLRYLENWDGVDHTFNGSLICLFESRIAKSQFWRNGGSGYYNPPKRHYNWDASLKTKEPPAGMPVLVQVKTNRLERIAKSEAVALAN